ncbi:MAG: SDH family Clp fold serine proteinase [Pyrinomonadaceae bacterium]
MPTWKDLLTEVQAAGSVYDVVRRKYLQHYSELTNRNVIIYYSGWLQKASLANHGYAGFGVNDNDKNGFMAAIHQLDRSRGLDLFLHTPGGDTAATESLVDYLRSMFDSDIRAVVPQIAMSAGTMIALSAKEVLMGKHSSLGPIDPQIGGIPAHGILEEFSHAAADISANPAMIPLWQPIISRYNPTLIGACQKAIQWCEQLAKEWLESGMFKGDADAAAKADTIIAELGSHALTKSHARHISNTKAESLGIKVASLEADQDLQDAVLSVHHATIQTLSATPACKIIENQLGVAYIETVGKVAA